MKSFIPYIIAICLVFISSVHAKEAQSERDSILIKAKILESKKLTSQLDASGLIELGRLFFYLAVEDKNYLTKAFALFDEIKSGANNTYRGESVMYLQALHAIRAKNALWPADKWSIANKALAQMDKIILQYPDNIEIRFIRASTCFYLPFFFNRKEQVKNDFIILSKLIPKSHLRYPKHLIRNICGFMLDSGYLSNEHFTEIKSLYSTLT
jgi:hypothetical protein